MTERIDSRCHVGETHGIYTMIDMLSEKDKYGHLMYVSQCNVCGFQRTSTYGDIIGSNNLTTTCKHLRANGQYIQRRHKWKNRRLRGIFAKMLNRCYSPNNKDYRFYGEKGISVYQEWLDDPKSFEDWAFDNGYQDNLTIDRINSDNNYCPENCQWIPIEENSRKAGNVNWITINDETLTGHQWAEKFGIGRNRINAMIREHGLEKTQELIKAMLKESPSTKERKANQSWFDVYGIQV